jgi:hypothetical protein
MRAYRLTFYVFAALVCGSVTIASAQAPPALSNDADTKEVAAYKLTMAAINKVDRAMRTAFVEMKKDPRFQERITLETELTTLRKKDEPTEAEQKRIEELEAKKEQLEASDPLQLNDAKNLDEMEAAIRKFPPLANALQQEGMTPREYSVLLMAMVQAAFAGGMQKSGMLKELPPGINAENVKFVLDHQAELQKMQQEWQTLGK